MPALRNTLDQSDVEQRNANNVPAWFHRGLLDPNEFRETEATIKLLLGNGADPNARAGEYGTVLCLVSYKCDATIMAMLLNAGADVNAQGWKYGDTLNAALAGTRDLSNKAMREDPEAVLNILVAQGAKN
ncbi:hypothetical protein IQ06DRAFT_301787 [Phaeosphaeriaceae sp. SRC1lsM3a]|nr:hypothetical protein IQ06DRAFT_301787 [Stagonospora sp. SRC1lsM3a]